MNRRFLCIVVALCAFLAAGCSSFKPVKASGKGGKPAPEFALQDEHGKTVRLSDYKGKVVILDFWATWCGPCKIEIPWFIEMQRKYKDKGFTVIGVSMDEGGWQEVRPFVEEMKMNYPVLIGNDDTATAFGGAAGLPSGNVEVLPTTFIIDKQGHIVATHQGLTGKDEFEKAIEALL